MLCALRRRRLEVLGQHVFQRRHQSILALAQPAGRRVWPQGGLELALDVAQAQRGPIAAGDEGAQRRDRIVRVELVREADW